MHDESFLTGLRNTIRPRAGAKARVRASVHASITADNRFFTEIARAVTPDPVARRGVWSRIVPFITLPHVATFERIAGTLRPGERFRQELKMRLLRTIRTPVEAVAYSSQVLKWSAAFVLFGLLVRLSPFLFIAAPTIAQSQAMLVPTRGEVSVSIGGLWQNVERDLALEPGMKLRTHDGEASIILNDDGVVRLDAETTVEINDLTDRLEPASDIVSSITLYAGRIWLQGLTSPQLRGITVTTRYGQVTVNEGSLSIVQNDTVDVEVYDRSATVQMRGAQTFLAAGERTRLSEENVLLVKKIPAQWYQYAWADQNLKRDAVHRHDIAQLQHERRIAQAGILSTSRLYPVKRLAERMDVLLTFGQQSKVQKRLQLAETRLNEAAALIYEGHAADTELAEYRETLQSIAENNESLATFLVARAIAQSTAQMAAALPGDESYVIKKTVLETSANLQNSVVRNENAQGSLLLDGLAVMLKAADQGNTDLVRSVWSDLHPYLLIVEDESMVLSPAMHKEAITLLSFLATSLHLANSRGVAIDPELLDDIAGYLPVESGATEVVLLSEEEIMQIVQGIRERIFTYNMTQPRLNQFIAELRLLGNHPDLGRILRRLAVVLPEGPEEFPERVYKEIVKLRWEKTSGEVI